MKKSFLSFVALVVLSLSVVSCGSAPSNVLDNVEVNTVVQDQDVSLSFSADLNLGAMSFANITVPVIHPEHKYKIGQLELVSQLGGVNKIKIDILLSEITNLQTTQALLPNGNMIPLIGSNPSIAIDIGGGAKVYLTVGTQTTAIGVAVPVKEFDKIGQSLPGLNFFPIVNKNGFIGTAGIFTGMQAGMSGIAVVADISSALKDFSIFKTPEGMMAQESSDEFIELNYSSHLLSKSQKSELDSMIYKLNQKKTKLRMH